MRKIFLHVGPPKTGTSSVQQVFQKSRDVLFDKCDLYVPKTALNLAPALRSIGTSSNIESGVDFNASAHELNSELLASSGHLFISGEGIANFDTDILNNVRDWLSNFGDVHAYFMLREPVSWATSYSQQSLKFGTPLSKLIATPPSVSFIKKIENLKACFGDSNVTVGVFERACSSENGLPGWFLDQFQLGSVDLIEEMDFSTGLVNPSLSVTGTYIFNAALSLFPDLVENSKKFKAVFEIIRRIPGRKFSFPQNTRIMLHKNSRRDVERLVKEYGVSEYLTPPPEPDDNHGVHDIPQAVWDEIASAIFTKIDRA